jgi:hypothetical protein
MAQQPAAGGVHSGATSIQASLTAMTQITGQPAVGSCGRTMALSAYDPSSTAKRSHEPACPRALAFDVALIPLPIASPGSRTHRSHRISVFLSTGGHCLLRRHRAASSGLCVGHRRACCRHAPRRVNFAPCQSDIKWHGTSPSTRHRINGSLGFGLLPVERELLARVQLIRGFAGDQCRPRSKTPKTGGTARGRRVPKPSKCRASRPSASCCGSRRRRSSW